MFCSESNHDVKDLMPNACGLERMAVGLSTDALLDPKFAARFCEPACQNSCPNIIDLFTKLVAVEGDLYSNLLSSNQQKLLLAHNFLINLNCLFLVQVSICQTCATFSGQKHEASLLDMASCTNTQGFWESMLLLPPSNKFRMMSFCVYIPPWI
ncbi:hypothetical protein O6H91_Y360700 [Diphasiastrum complanatum]|nr:hypothetical protein O6H91_Y360700 [Diphasiastrum complanatum]